jgi:TRAP-type C4-dicarboxylate transport system substrate-binding protein
VFKGEALPVFLSRFYAHCSHAEKTVYPVVPVSLPSSSSAGSFRCADNFMAGSMGRNAFVLTLAFLAICTGAAIGAEKKYSWKLSHTRPRNSSVDKDAQAFVDQINKATDGRITISIYPDSQLGDYHVVQERIGTGSVEMAIQPVSFMADKQMQLPSMPYLVKDWDGVRKNCLSGTPFMNWAEERFAKQDIRLLAVWPVCFGGIALTRLPPSRGDPSVPKNIKVRVIPQKSFELLASSQGYLATPLPFSETFIALQAGIVDGAFGAGAEDCYSNFRDVLKFYVPADTHLEQWYVIMNKAMWDFLSVGDKRIIGEAARIMEVNRIKAAPQETKLFEDRLNEYGVKVLPLTPVESDKLAVAARKAIIPEIRAAIGGNDFDAAMKTVAE